ncbi:MAG: hypothetical protein K2M22_06635 [Lachnospiraceae bacterium]|nr:hypothetical protein [Lachnospiraceae bacterium]MDE7178592.1 hypothetical protein [Lachnospiraceae bacterium]
MNIQKMKEILKKIFILPPVPTLLIAIPSYVLVIYVLANGMMNQAISYAAYLLSAYALIITITGMAGIVRLIREGIDKHPLVKKALDDPLVGRYLREDMFRAEAALYQGFFINLLYAGIKMFSGIFYRSVWFATLAVYYILLATMRASLLYYVRKDGKNKISEWHKYRLCGISLLFMNIALAGIIVLVIHQNRGFVYPGVLIYVMSMYAFYATITAVWNVVKFRRYGSPVMSAAKVISLTAALVSMLSLEIAMLAQFGSDDDQMFRLIMTASTGAGISMIVLGMAVFMIWRSTKQLKQCKQEKEI